MPDGTTDDREIDGKTVLELLRELPGGRELLELAAEVRQDVELVGGAVRDLLLGRVPRELDVVVARDAASFAAALASRLGVLAAEYPSKDPTTITHDRFGTAVVRWEAGTIDIASRRAESYPAPGALPEVRAGTAAEDLGRRDFTVNALAVALDRDRRGELRSAPGALEDLAAGRLRVLHERSFVDDPTRLLRLARYHARLGFEIETQTVELAGQAIAAGALQTISGARIGAELRLALSEPDALAALAALEQLGVLEALLPGLRVQASLTRRALSILPEDGRPDLLLLASLLLPARSERAHDSGQAMFAFLDELEFAAGARDRVIGATLSAPGLVGEMHAAATPSQMRAAVSGVSVEAIALAAALGEEQPVPKAADAAREWLDTLRHVRLTITGDDLLAAGVPVGPEVGARLELALRRRLDGELDQGRAAELSAALAPSTRDLSDATKPS